MDQPIAMELPMADHTAEARISLHPHTPRVRIPTGDSLIADTRNALELRELGYPHRKCVPQADVDISRFMVSSTVTHCPFKGDSTYYSLPDIAGGAWSHEISDDEMQAVAGLLAFDAEKVT